jgi:hypothetical protein
VPEGDVLEETLKEAVAVARCTEVDDSWGVLATAKDCGEEGKRTATLRLASDDEDEEDDQ